MEWEAAAGALASSEDKIEWHWPNNRAETRTHSQSRHRHRHRRSFPNHRAETTHLVAGARGIPWSSTASAATEAKAKAWCLLLHPDGHLSIATAAVSKLSR